MKDAENADSYVPQLQHVFGKSYRVRVIDGFLFDSLAMLTTMVSIIVNCGFKPNSGESLIPALTQRFCEHESRQCAYIK